MKRIYIHTDTDGIATPFETLTDLCSEHGLNVGTVRNTLLKSNIYRSRQGVTVNDTYLRESLARKRPGNSRNWTASKPQ
jgi:hypothetical protein